MNNFSIVWEIPHNDCTERVNYALTECLKTATNILEATASIGEWIPDYNIGHGGNHIWISHKETNERKIVIYIK